MTKKTTSLNLTGIIIATDRTQMFTKYSYLLDGYVHASVRVIEMLDKNFKIHYLSHFFLKCV